MKKIKFANQINNADQERYWQAVINNDSSFDGHFVYGVRSTGIYCKPSCSSKLPRREQVVFFALPEAAEQTGFRPCKRCRPQMGEAQSPQVKTVQAICRIIEGHDQSKPLTLADLGAQMHLSPEHLQKTFKKVMGVTPRQYSEACRMNRMKAFLKEGQAVSGALYEAGYSSSSRLYEKALINLGMTPSSYRMGGKDMQIKYLIQDSPFGRLLVAATEKGICAVSLGDSDQALIEALRSEYPAADLRQDTAFNEVVAAIINYLLGRQLHLDLPVDIRASAFRLRVYEALKAIPYGKTCSYEAVARAVGNPKAVRAVGSACSNNPVALVIPCHRVIRKDGSLGGYRWGLGRKEKLLEMEKKALMKKEGI